MKLTAVTVSYAGFFRFSDLIRIQWHEIRFLPSHMELFLEKSKNDQYREGRWVLVSRVGGPYCPVALVEKLLAVENYSLFGPDGLIRNVTISPPRQPHLRCDQPCYSTVLGWFKEGVKLLNLNPDDYGTHSGRRGGATRTANTDVPDRLFKEHGGWRSERAKDGYVVSRLQARLSFRRSVVACRGPARASPIGADYLAAACALESAAPNRSGPLVKQASNARFMTHKGGVVPRAMLVADVVPHDEDPDCKELLPIVRIPVGKGANSSRVVTLILGCSKHTCDICLKAGHLAEVHEKFADRSTAGKRKASGNLIHAAKRRETAPPSTLLAGVLEDPFTEFVEGKSLNQEAWRCSACEDKSGGPAFGLSYTGAIAHIASDRHLEKLAKGELFFVVLMTVFSFEIRFLHNNLT
ncbi:hypothetical protein KFL_014200010 [Klebsormidium nitens]|uniref:Uncharacterized protein n=1 Tax=Klebsormidium nitens TaxID=105231 RepID=A0A1Y1IUK0_KLENI|nr:hypothetical protein KFL_014200010 [Klebsormidium nitens]|eukprot:GAQ93289.1 hypothetical protein KFL_014200010 [Klebsormidium nitens]